ncbi:MAG: J domain-containing protein [Acidobacteria bacterium]|nr:J domain-containing protein [Acidobacteriota bacterium]
MSLYDDLGVAKGATPEEIRAAHKALARLLHPDRIQDEVTRRVAETTLKKINSAFAVLSDSRRRMAYDRELERELDIAGAASAAAAAAAAAGERKGGAAGWSAGGWRRWVEKRANWDWAKRNALWGAGTVAGLTVIYLTLWQGAPAARRTAAAPMPEVVKAEPKAGKRERARVRAAVKEPVREPARSEEAPRVEVAAAVEPARRVERAPSSHRRDRGDSHRVPSLRVDGHRTRYCRWSTRLAGCRSMS